MGFSDYDLIGFGSGINFGKHHKVLLDFADKLPQVTDKKGFIFSTSGQTGDASKFHKKLREKLESKGFGIVGSLTVQDLTPNALLKIVGGIQKEHPNEDDLKQAETFAQSIKQPAKA